MVRLTGGETMDIPVDRHAREIFLLEREELT
jgi:hypothetical protein